MSDKIEELWGLTDEERLLCAQARAEGAADRDAQFKAWIKEAEHQAALDSSEAYHAAKEMGDYLRARVEGKP